jgi:hypothetical protein
MDGLDYAQTTEDSLYYRFNSAMRGREPAEVELWADFARIIDCALGKLPPQEVTVYRGFHVSLTQVSHEFQQGKVVWLVSITSASTDEKRTLKFFGSGSSSSPGTLMKIHALSAKDIKAFSVIPAESELVLSLNTCLSIERVVTSQELMSLKGLIEDLPENVDLIVARQQYVSADAVASAIAQDALDLNVFKSQQFSRSAGLPSSAAAHHPSYPLASSPAPASVSSATWQSLLQDLQGALTPEAVASVKYYRDTAFAASICSEYSEIEAAAGKLEDAALYTAASKTLHAIAAGQGSPTPAGTLGTLLAQARLAVPEIEAAQSAATTAKDYPNAAELQKMRILILLLISQADDLLQENPAAWPLMSALQRFSLPLQRLTTKVLSKKWILRHFVLCNRRLYHADGDNGFSNSRDGTLSFVRVNPSPSRRHCLELKDCTVAACSAPVDGQAFAFELKFPAGSQLHKDVYLAADDDATRQRCVRVIQAASAGGASSSLHHIASAAALTAELLEMKRLPAIKAVFDVLGIGMSDPCLKAAGFDLPSLKAAGFDAAAFTAIGCNWSDLKAAGFASSDCKALGCDLASLQSAGYDVLSQIADFGYDAVASSGCDVSRYSALKGQDINAFFVVIHPTLTFSLFSPAKSGQLQRKRRAPNPRPRTRNSLSPARRRQPLHDATYAPS